MLGLVKSCIGTKFTGQFGDLIAVSILLLFGLDFPKLVLFFVFYIFKFLSWIFILAYGYS